MTEKKAAATEKFEKMLEQGHDNPMLRFTLGNAYWKEGDFDNAVMHLTEAVTQKQDYSAAWKILGRVYFDAKMIDQSKEAYLSGLQSAVDNGDKQTEKEITVFLKRIEKAESKESTDPAPANQTRADDADSH